MARSPYDDRVELPEWLAPTQRRMLRRLPADEKERRWLLDLLAEHRKPDRGRIYRFGRKGVEVPAEGPCEVPLTRLPAGNSEQRRKAAGYLLKGEPDRFTRELMEDSVYVVAREFLMDAARYSASLTKVKAIKLCQGIRNASLELIRLLGETDDNLRADLLAVMLEGEDENRTPAEDIAYQEIGDIILSVERRGPERLMVLRTLERIASKVATGLENRASMFAAGSTQHPMFGDPRAQLVRRAGRLLRECQPHISLTATLYGDLDRFSNRIAAYAFGADVNLRLEHLLRKVVPEIREEFERSTPALQEILNKDVTEDNPDFEIATDEVFLEREARRIDDWLRLSRANGRPETWSPL